MASTILPVKLFSRETASELAIKCILALVTMSCLFQLFNGWRITWAFENAIVFPPRLILRFQVSFCRYLYNISFCYSNVCLAQVGVSLGAS
jgi:hypothetical protein